MKAFISGIIAAVVIIVVAVAIALIVIYVKEGPKGSSSSFTSISIPSLLASYEKASNFTNTEIGAIMYCYKNQVATERAIKKFREFYPKGDLVVFSDAGFDYSSICREANAKYIHYNTNLDCKWRTAENAFEWFERINNAISYVKNRWIMILEDDVEMKGRFTVTPSAGVWGGKPHLALVSTELTHYLFSKRRGSRPLLMTDNRIGYGGSGGSILDGQRWKKSYKSEQVRKYLTEMRNAKPDPNNDQEILHADICFSSLYILWGDCVKPNPEWVEHYDPDPENPRYALIHSFKKYYPDRK
jgi:hypothetical protein